MKLLRYFPFLFILQLLLIVLIPGLSYNMDDKFWLIALSLAFCLIFMLGTTRIIAAIDSSQSRFNARYFGTMGLRMLIGLIFIVIYLKFSGVINKPGTIFLICSYFAYMGFEIKIILSKLRTNSEKSKHVVDAQK